MGRQVPIDGGPQYYALDVECVATGLDHNARAVAQIGLVDAHGRELLNIFVKPNEPVVSCLTAITGITPTILETKGISLGEARERLLQVLPSTATLVGQNVMQDVRWLNLKERQDFASMLDLMGLYRVWNAQYRNFTIFNQDHLARVLLNWAGEGPHDAVRDAQVSMQLFHCHARLQSDPGMWDQAQQALLDAPRKPSFASQNPIYDNVCMGNRRTCRCGAPFFS